MVTSPNETPDRPKHAGVARRTPYELVFTEGDFESRVFPLIRDEAAAEDVASVDPQRFTFLSTVGDVLREVTPEEAPPDALEQYRSLLYQAFHFWLGDRPVFVVEPPVARFLIEAPPSLEGCSFEAPSPAGYIQLPANLFWSSISPDATPEPVDGFFFAVSERKGPAGEAVRHLEILMVLGIHRSRAGFSVIPIETQLGPEMVEPLAQPAREQGDFANVLPGGEISGLYSILTFAEVIKLLVRLFWYVERFPDASTEVIASEPRDEDADPPPTHLAYTRIGLGAAEGNADGAHTGD